MTTFVRAPLLAWLLCAFVILASADNVPDPPGVNPHTAGIKLQNVLKHGHQTSGVYAAADVSNTVRSQFTQSALVIELRRQTYTTLCALLVRVAADPSPPSCIETV